MMAAMVLLAFRSLLLAFGLGLIVLALTLGLLLTFRTLAACTVSVTVLFLLFLLVKA